MASEHTLPHEHGVGVKILVGSNVQPKSWKLKDGGVLQLGDVVRLAQKLSRLSIDEWNTMDEKEREEWIAHALTHYKNEIEESK